MCKKVIVGLSRFILLRNLKKGIKADYCGAQPTAKIRSDPSLQSYYDCGRDIQNMRMK